ncbi:MAG: exo-alpha-sialidase [Armatimonadetes bacterium]|nr:exo-alpha-sialidase [Armatimonadota bacterium]
MGRLLLVVLGLSLAVPSVTAVAEGGRRPVKLTLLASEQLPSLSPLVYATYLKPKGLEMVKVGGYSPDNGRTWVDLPPQPDFEKDLPHGYRRETFPLFADYATGRLVRVVPSMDTPGLDPNIVEPPIALETYYLRYRVSVDGGKTYLFDEQIIQQGHTPDNPFDGVYYGKNGIFMGDVGSQLLRTRAGRIIIPAQACCIGADGKLSSPGGGFTYTDAVMIIGTWTRDNRLSWEVSQPIQADPKRSTRGMIEPTVAELPDGRLLCVMRGSNGGALDPEFKIPSYRWFSVSRDGGYHWTTPAPWTYDDGAPFFSPSSMSQLLRHSSGRYFWLGNISEQNCRGNDPRYPLYIGEVDPKSLCLVRSSLLAVDTKKPDEAGVNLSHWWAFEDRETREVVIVGARYGPGYTTTSPWLWRVGVTSPHY